jgi:TonB family protein
MVSGARTAQDWNEWEGRIIDGKFPLLGYLGGTERSAVFLTERPEGEPRRAAIKLVPANGSAVEALLARWTAAAPLSHPDLLRMFETGSGALGHVEFAYVVMEYAEENLAQVDRPLTEAEAIDMLAGVLQALAYLHGQRLAHGHLKPSNILAVSDQLKISSDTIRPAGEWRSNLDVPGLCDPPEIAQEGASSAGDTWSAGVTLVAALTKQMPAWDRGALAVSVLDRLPTRFRAPVSNCLRLDPRQRWTVADLAEWLRPKPQTQVGSPNEPSRPRMARGRFLMTAGAIAVVLAATAIVSRLTSDRAAEARPVVGPQELKSGPASRPPAPQPKPGDVQPKTAASKSAAESRGQGVLMQVLPDVPAQARNTIRGKVLVNIRVGVEAGGSVVEARNESPQSSRFFGNLALQAARRWKFEPAGSSAHPAEWDLHFQFVRDPQHPVSVKAVPAR